MVKHKIILLTFLVYLYQSFGKKYNNYTLYRGIPVNDVHLNFFRNLTYKYDVNFWREPGLLNKPIDFMISPIDLPAFQQDSSAYGLYLTTIMADVQQAFDLQTVKSYIRRRTDSFDWQNYFRIEDIYNWLRDLASVYPKVVKLKTIGRTFENRDIMGVIVNFNVSENKKKIGRSHKPKVFIEGGIHAREWIAPAFVTYLINTIVHAPYSDDPTLKKIANTYEWFFVPVLNPDGYEFTHTKDRLWRKNRRAEANGIGIDLNRNFGYGFGTEGISFETKSEIYCGPKAFSENESKAMAKFVKVNSENLEFYLGFHSYGQYIILPYAHSKKHMENFKEVKLMGDLAAKQIKSKFGTQYTVGTAFDTVGYMTSGISADWVKNSFRTPVVATFELRDGGRYGFALPASQILPTCEETTSGLISLLTPREKGWKNSMLKEDLQNNSQRTILDGIVILCNVMWFIIVRFDYFLWFYSSQLLNHDGILHILWDNSS